MLREQAGSFFQDETKLELNPRVGFCWMRKAKQRHLRTPGTNRKVWISGTLRWSTGRFHWVVGERKNDELFMKLLEHLKRTYRSHRQLHLAADNDSSHTSNRVKEYLREEGQRIRLLHPLPPYRAPRAIRWR